MMKMEKNEKNKSKGFKGLSSKAKTVLSILLCVAAVIVAVIFTAQKAGNVTITSMAGDVKDLVGNMGSGDGFPYELSADSVRDIEVINSEMLLLLNNRTMILNSTAKEINPVELKFSNPVMKTKDSMAIVYDLDSAKFRIQNGSEVTKEGEADGRIMAAAYGRRGNYAFGTYGKDVQSVFTVYNKKGEKQFGWSFKTERISDIALSDNGNTAAVTTVDSKEGKIGSKVYVFRFDTDKPVSQLEYDSSVLVRIDFVRSNDIVVLGDNIRSYIKDGKTRKDDLQFKTDKLNSYSVSAQGRTALVRSKYGSSSICTLDVYSARNKLQFSTEFNREVKDVDCGEKYTAVLFENEIKTFDKKGRGKGTIQFVGEPSEVFVIGSDVYVMTSINIQCYDVKGNVK